jgi:putative membrane-bound dehydrogenase-like protein
MIRTSLALLVLLLAASASPPADPDKPRMTEPRKDVKPFEYVPAKVPFYPPGKKWGTTAEPINRMQKPLPADESAKHFVTPVDFEMTVFVTETQLGGKPIAMAWDEQGRLWVSVTVDYPNELQPEGQGRDKIVVCEDTDGDGVCDKVTTFADRLSIPTSLLPYAGGVIVHQAPHTLFLKDTDGDGKADVRQVLFTGWATNDTHAGPSNLRYGFDNWIYGAVGYAGFNGTVNGEKLNFKQGYYRFKVEKSDKPNELKVTRLEFLRSTNNNTWGLAFDESGQIFGSTANGCPLVHLPIPNRYYEKVKGLTPSVLQNIAPDNHFEPITDKVRQVDWHGGFTSAANCAIYTARTYPKEYWNRTAFVSDPTGHLTATFVLEPDGATYKAHYGWNLVASDDEWCAPIDAQVGPDGHVWVLDWYSFIVQHNPTPSGFKTGKGNAYETELRDKKHGRIYRLVYTKAKPEPRVNLKGATPEKLVETLKHHNLGWRLHAQRLLVERGKTDVAGALFQLLEERPDEQPGAVHALWALHGLGSFQRAPVLTPLRRGFEQRLHRSLMLHDQPPAARRAAVAVLAHWPTTFFQSRLTHGATDDPDAGVRLAALLALADRGEHSSGSEYGEAVARAALAARDHADPVLRDALTVAAARHGPYFLRALHKYPDFLFLGPDAPKDRTTPFPKEVAAIIPKVARTIAGSPGLIDIEMSEVLINLDRADPRAADAIVTGLADGWPAGRPVDLSPEAAASFAKVLAGLPPASRPKMLKLGTVWGVKGLDAQLAEATASLFKAVADAKATDADRVAAAKQVVEFQPQSDEAAARLLEAVTQQASPALAAGIFEALSASKSKAVGAAVVAKLKDLPPAARPAALRLVLAKTDSATAFLDAVEKGALRFDVLDLDQKAALASHPDQALAGRTKKLLALGGGLPSPDRQKVIDELRHVVEKTGDAANGKKMFAQHCAKCHKHGGEGTQVGPDLTGMAVHPKEELLIHILDPSRSVEGNYKAYRVTTTDGRTLVGLLASESKTAVEVIDADGKRVPLSRDDIESLKETDKSLMPEGFEKQMKPQELADLLEFLTLKGKYVPLPLDKVATVVSTRGVFNGEANTAERLAFPDWTPKTFKGVPFVLVDPQGERVKNAVLLYSESGTIPPKMPRSVSLPLNGKAKAIHLLGGVAGWASPGGQAGSVSMVVRLHYADGQTEDHELKNGEHVADYSRRVDVPGSEFAFALGPRQVRYLAVTPKRDAVIKAVELVKGPDRTAPVVMAVTAETP